MANLTEVAVENNDNSIICNDCGGQCRVSDVIIRNAYPLTLASYAYRDRGYSLESYGRCTMLRMPDDV